MTDRQTVFTQAEALAFINKIGQESASLRSGLESQTAFVLANMAVPVSPCPSCDAPVNAFMADPDHTYNIGATDRNERYVCPSCERPLRHEMALFGGQMYWVIDHERERVAQSSSD
jgi:hypothetical protein